jgi:hypothetical protein
VEGSRYPVLERTVSRQVVNGNPQNPMEEAYVFHPLDQEALPEDTANFAIREKQTDKQPSQLRVTENRQVAINDAFTINTHPNPVVNDLQVGLHLIGPAQVEVSLYNLQGQLLYHRNFRVQGETTVETVNMNRYARGNYILKVQAGERSERKVIVKQ